MPKKFEPLVTAIITTHNRKHLLSRAVESVVNQTYKNLELIIVDDGSTDGTEQSMQCHLKQYSFIQYVLLPVSKGACYARNYGIKSAKGKYIAGLDDDDEWTPNRIETFVNSYDPKYSMLGSYDLMKSNSRSRVAEKKHIITLEDMLYRNIFGNQAFVEKERILKLGGFDESLPSAQDYDMWTRIIKSYSDAKIIPECLQIIHTSEGERITRSPRAFKGYFMYYKKHKGLMTLEQRKYQLYRLYQSRGKKISLKTLIKLFSRENLQELGHYYIMHSSLKTTIKLCLRKIGGIFSHF